MFILDLQNLLSLLLMRATHDEKVRVGAWRMNLGAVDSAAGLGHVR
jgi:hypothetical protein